MLKCKDCCRYKDCTLFSVGDALEHRAQSNLGFAESDVTAEKSVHGIGFFHILFDFMDTAQLVIGFNKLKSAFEIVLHINIGRE